MTVEIKHNQSFWEQGPQNAEEIHAVQQLQTGLYNIAAIPILVSHGRKTNGMQYLYYTCWREKCSFNPAVKSFP